MRPRDFQDVLSRVPGARQSGDSWTAPCLAPGHKTPEKHLTLRDAGDKALVTCQGGRHDYRAICSALGFTSLKYSDNGGGGSVPHGEARTRGQIDCVYSYVDAHGKPFECVRFKNPKGFAQRQPDGKGDYVWSLVGIEPTLYRQDELAAAIAKGDLVYFVEGEKDVDRLRGLGLVATTNPMGAGKWDEAYSQALRGADMVIIPDNDKAGRAHVQKVARSCCGIARRVRLLELPVGDKGDVSDWLDQGHTVDELKQLAAQCPDYAPPAHSGAHFRLTRLADLLEEPAEDVSWLWERTLPTFGLSLLAAKPKVGKSTLARCLALNVSRGESFLGRATSPGPVVYLALEEKRSEVKAHFERMGATDEPIFIHVGSAPETALAELKAVIAETKAVLAIVDPLLRLVRLRDGNDYAEVTRELEPLLMLARETGCHILAVHHLGKGEREGGDSILGSTALFATVDAALLMKRRDAGRTLESIQRYGEDIPRMALGFASLTGTLTALGSVEEMETQQTAGAICDALAEHEKTEKEIREELGGNTGLTGRALRWLRDEGYVKREGSGKRNDAYRYFLVSRFSICDKQEKLEKRETADLLEV